MAPDQESTKLIVDTFRRFDANGDGLISKEELTTIFLKISPNGGSITEEAIDLLIKAADTNKDGKIQYEEFVNWVMHEKEQGRKPFAACRSSSNFDRPLEKRGTMTFNYRVFLPERFEADIGSRYALDKLTLGEGGYGKVFIAKDREFEGRRVAVKKVTKTNSREVPDALQQEISVMKELDHPNICKLLGTWQQGRVMYFVMELCEGGELFDRIIATGSITESMSSDIIRQVSSALAYAQSRGIAHRDIKPENVVFCTKDPKDTQVKLIDWGLAHVFIGMPMMSAVGSFTYAAPEVITCNNRIEYTAACDLWSLGVLTYVMLCGKPPFWGSQANHLKNARAEKYPMTGSPWTTMNPRAIDFVRSLMKAKAAERLPIEKVVEHPWLVQSSSPELVGERESAEVFRNLQHFSDSSTFERMCITAVARQLDHHHLKDVHKVFRSMDANGDGVLSLEEVSKGFKSIFGEDSSAYKQVLEVYERMDVDGSKCIDYTEFCAAGLGQKKHTQDEVIWAAFKTFDANNSGFIEKQELGKLLDLADVQDEWTAEVCQEVSQEIVQLFDKDGDGRINFEDWKGIMQRCWQQKLAAKNGGSASEISLDEYNIYELLAKVNELPVE